MAGKPKDMAGQVVGRWTIGEYAGAGKWHATCECGREGHPSGSVMRLGKSSECGYCSRLSNATKEPGQNSFTKLYYGYRGSARFRGYEFALSKAEAYQLFTSNCYYCGVEPLQIKNHEGSGDFLHNGIDRFDNSLGYTAENSVSCCWLCNRGKSTLSAEEFVAWAKRVAEHNR